MDPKTDSEVSGASKGSEGAERQLDADKSRFYTMSFGSNVDEAFQNAIERVRWAHDRGPGTIVDKENRGYTMIAEAEHEGKHKRNYARTLLDEADDRVTSGDRPAGAIDLSGTEAARRYRDRQKLTDEDGSVWLFFGIANHADLDDATAVRADPSE